MLFATAQNSMSFGLLKTQFKLRVTLNCHRGQNKKYIQISQKYMFLSQKIPPVMAMKKLMQNVYPEKSYAVFCEVM